MATALPIPIIERIDSPQRLRFERIDSPQRQEAVVALCSLQSPARAQWGAKPASSPLVTGVGPSGSRPTVAARRVPADPADGTRWGEEAGTRMRGDPSESAYDVVAYPPADSRPAPLLCEVVARRRKREPCAAVSKHGWTRQEDTLIMRAVDEWGTKWSRIAAELPGRTDDAVRNRYIRLKKKRVLPDGDDAEPSCKRGDMWTPSEDEAIMEGVAIHGFKWQLIAEMLSGRSVNAVRNRYLRVAQNYNVDPA